MKCSRHGGSDAVATCVFCGRAVCPSCVAMSTSGRVVCSSQCEAGLSSQESALSSLSHSAFGSTRVGAYFLLGVGALFGIFALLETPSALATRRWFLPLFFLLTGLAFLASGKAMLKLSKYKKEPEAMDK